MTTYFFGANNVVLTLCLCLGLSACQKEDFYQKEFLENPYKVTTPDPGETVGGNSGGVEGPTVGGADSGSTVGGADSGSTVGGTDGGTTVGGTDGGSTVGGTDGGSTVGGTDGGSTVGGTDGGSTVGGTDGGSTVGGTDGGSTVGGTDGGSTVGGTDGGSTVGGTDGGTTVGGTDGGSTVGGTDGGACGNNGHGNNEDGIDSSNPGSGSGGPNGEIDGAWDDEIKACVIIKSEAFTQTAEATKKLDVLWVVDNSGSMGDEQDSLGRNFDAFISEFIKRDVDFKMAITTTDPRSTRQGLMVSGSDNLLTSQMAQNNPLKFMDDFKNLIKVGISGSGDEQGLAGASAFKNRYENSFFRNDAYLAIVVVSDEEDSSPNSVASYISNLQSLKSNSGFVKIYSIVDLDNSNTGYGVSTGSQRYQLASDLTSGTKAEIHNDFYQTLLSMGESIINLLDSFALASSPVAGTLQVFVDGVLVNGGYSYDAGSNSIKFDDGAVPPAGSTIRVTYKVIK